MATTQTDSFGMSPEFIAAQQAKANAAKTVSASAPIETANIGGTPTITTPTNVTTPPVAPVQPVTPTTQPVATTPAKVDTPLSTVTAPETPSYTSKEGLTTTPTVGETPEQARARTAAFAQENIAARKKKPPVAKVTTPVATTTPTTTTPVDYTKITGRENEVLTNLNNAFSAGMTTPDAIRSFADYNNATPEKKAFVDNFIAGKQVKPDENAIFSSILQGNTAGFDTKTPEFNRAKNRVSNYQKFANFSSDQFSTLLKNGDITPGSQTYRDLSANPDIKAKITKAESLNRVNGATTNTDKATENIMNEVVNETEIGKAFRDGIITGEEMNRITTTPEITAKQEEVQKKKDEYDKIKAEYDNIGTDVDNELKGTGATSSYAASLKAERQMKLFKQLQVLQDVYNNAFGTLSDMKKTQSDLFSANLGLYKDQTAYDRQKALADYQAKLALSTEQAKFEQGLKQQEALANDPYTAIKSIMDKYEKDGITFTQDATKKLADFKASGKTLQEYTTQMLKDIQAKPEFKRQQEIKLGQMSDIEKMKLGQQFDIDKLKMSQNFEIARDAAKSVTEKKWTKLDDGMYQDSEGNIATADELKNAKLFSNTYLSANKGETGGECGFYASRATGLGSTPGGNSKSERINQFSDTKPEIGGMALFTGPGYDKTYGHISVITGIDETNGTIEIKESNYNGDKKVTTRTVPMSSVTGYYNNTPLAKGVGGTGGEKKYTDSEIELYAELANMDASARNTALKAQGIPLKDVTDYMAAAKAGKVDTTQAQKTSANTIMEDIANLVKMNDYEDATGRSNIFPTIEGGDAYSAGKAIDNLVGKLTMGNLGLLKGPMSDKDIEFLKATSSKLDKGISDEQFNKNLIELYNVSARKAGMPEVKSIEEIQKGTSSTASAIDSYYGQGTTTTSSDVFNNYYNQ